MRLRSSFLILSAALAFAACGLEDYPYLEPVDADLQIEDINPNDTKKFSFRLDSESGSSYLKGYIIFYRLYAGDTIDSVNQRVDADRVAVSALNDKYQSSLLYTDLTNKLQFKVLRFSQTEGVFTDPFNKNDFNQLQIDFDFNTSITANGFPMVYLGSLTSAYELVRDNGEYFDISIMSSTDTDPTEGDIEMSNNETFQGYGSRISILMYILAYGLDIYTPIYSNATRIGPIELQ